MRVLVCGGRNYSDARYLYGVLDGININNQITCLIEGGARGADLLAATWSAARNIKNHQCFTANWSTHGPSAGPRRNQRMIDEGHPHLVVAFPGGEGTSDMIQRAQAAGIAVHRVDTLVK